MPISTLPFATTGVEYVSVPRSATHFIFLPVSGLKVSGRLVSPETMFREYLWPHCGWSSALIVEMMSRLKIKVVINNLVSIFSVIIEYYRHIFLLVLGRRYKITDHDNHNLSEVVMEV